MRTKILVTILLFSQLFTLGLAIDYTMNPVNPAQGANTVAQSQPATTGVCINGFGWNGQLCVPCMQVKNGYCTCTKYGGCDTKVCDSTLTNCQVLINGQNSYILLRATGCNNYAWGDSNTSVICTQCSNGYFMVAGICVKPNQCAQMNLVTGTCDTCVDGYYFSQNFQLQTLQSWDYYLNINQVICNQCLNNCKICTSGYTCVQCQDQYYWSPTASKSSLSNTQNDTNAGQCLACNANITSCIKCQNATTCDQCLDGWYYTAPSDQSTKGTCTQCMNNCLKCQNGDTCDTCDTVHNYIYLQGNTSNSCASCSGITGCQTCSTTGGVLACTACLSGYVFDSNNVCQKCDVNCTSNSCSFTNNQVQCSNCVSTFVLKSSTTCVTCGTGCQSCSYSDQAQTNITCGQCQDTYYKDNNACQLCSSQISGCQKCNFNSQNTPTVTCTQCSTTTKLTNDSQQCLSSPANCLDYSVTSSANPATCNKCADTYYLDSGSCTACSTSDVKFLRCSKSGTTITVIQCVNGYFLFNNQCVSAKDQNTQATNLSLQTCQTIATGPQCASCLPAALGTTPPQSGVCSYCNCSSAKGNCSATVSGTTTTVACTPNPTCLPGFYLNGSSCLPCLQTVDNLTGTQNCCGLGLIFTAGTPGLTSDRCVAQPNATGKQQLLTSNANANICDIGYYYNTTDKICNTCIANCDNCVDATTCKTCSLNYTLIQNSNSVSCVLIKCLVVDSTKGCTACQYGFYLSTINSIGYCLQCLSPLTNSVCRAYLNQAPNVTIAPATPVAVSANLSYACANGQYWNSQYCSPCKTLPTSGTTVTGYCVCSTYLDCTSIVCVAGYALIQNTCQLIPTGCSTYIVSNDGTTLVCTSCIASYSLVANICLPNQNCQQFSATTGNCVQCASGYYLNWKYNYFVAQNANTSTLYFNNFPSQCTACTLSNCLTCTGPTVCTTCSTGYFWQTSQYLQQSSNGSQGSCQPCMQGCQTCTNNQSCQTCFSGYYMVFPYSGINYCQLCSTVTAISNCLTCDTSQTAPHAQSLIPTCRSCPSGYYLYSGKCVVCTGGCIACDADNSCTQCASQGYAYDQTNKKCVACTTVNAGCTSCSYNGTQLGCSACADTYYRDTSNNTPTCSLCSSLPNKFYKRCVSSTSPTQCIDNYYLNGSNCTPIIANKNCLTFDSSQNCTSCISGYIIVGSECQQCTQKTNVQCTKCQVIANTGSSQSASLQCAACATGYYLTTTFTCSACPNVKGCDVCNSAGCQTCSSGYYPTAVTTDTNNSTGTTTSNNTVTCNNCVSNCSICQQANSCTKCADRYFLVTTTSSGTTSVTTSSCYACQPECQTCVAPGTTCTSCIAGYVFQNGGCVTLVQANCYSNGTNGCAVCLYGFYLNNGVCYQCLNPQADFLCTNPVDNLLTSATTQQQ